MINKEKAFMALGMILFLGFLVLGARLFTNDDPGIQAIGFMIILSTVIVFMVIIFAD